MEQLKKVVYQTEAVALSGAIPFAETTDKMIHLKIGPPKELGGTGEGVNPEQIFAVGYATCFLGTMSAAARKLGQNLPVETKVTCKVGLGPVSVGFNMEIWLKIELPGMDKIQIESLVSTTHAICPYSNSVRNGAQVHLEY